MYDKAHTWPNLVKTKRLTWPIREFGDHLLEEIDVWEIREIEGLG